MPPMKRPATPGHREYAGTEYAGTEYAGTWSLGEAAHRFNMTKKSFRRLLGTGQLSFVQIRGRFRIPVDAANRYLTAHG